MNRIKEILILTLATLILALSVFFFLIPSQSAVCSISGLAIVLSKVISLSVSAITLFFNAGLLILGFVLCGQEFGYKTIYTSILLPVFLGVLEHIFPNTGSLTGNQLLDILCYIVTGSTGLSILFNRNASSGGLDIVAKIMSKYFHMEIGTAMGISGILVAASSIFVFDMRTFIISLLGTYFNGIILDYMIFGQNGKKKVCIISLKREREIREWILHSLHSGATIYEVRGAYDDIVRNEIITIVDRAEYQRLMGYLSKTDPTAFITVYNVNEVHYIKKTVA